jgi:3',5'-cyclic AMP phosphodiesterase CpdA
MKLLAIKKTILFYMVIPTVLFCWSLAVSAGGDAWIAGPYLRDISQSSVTILWETPEKTGGTLSYGTSKTRYDLAVHVSPGTLQQVTLTQLRPGTVYYYQLQTGAFTTPAGDPNYYFKTAVPDAEPFQFAVYADTSSGRNGFDLDHGKVIRSIINYSHPDLVFINGDLVTNGRSHEDWLRFLQVEGELIRNVPIYAIPGNNDQPGITYFHRYFTSPRQSTWYSFDYEGCHFITLDILRGQGDSYYSGFRPGNPQFSWLLKDLQSEANRNAKFTLVFFHAPVFSPDGNGNKVLEQLLHPLFVKYGVDLVFNGTHSFTRAEKDGVFYLISGGGGAEIKPGSQTKLPEIKETAYLLHHLRVSVNYPVINCEVVDINGSIYSSFTYWDPRAKNNRLAQETGSPVALDDFKTKPAAKNEIPLAVFSLPNCGYCQTLISRKIPGLAEKSGLKLPVTYLPLNQADNFEKLVALEQMLNDRDNELPAVLIGNKILGGKQEIERDLEKTILGSGPVRNALKDVTSPQTKEVIATRFRSFQVLPVIAAGLLDGINPCAFTTIIFLLSYLFYLGKKKKEVLIAGISFAGGVFLTYIGLGMGLSELLTSLSAFKLISLAIKYLTFAIVIVLGVFSLYDYYLCLKGRVTDISLQLPGFLKSKIHQQVRTQTRKPGLILASFGLGFFVSTFELACTGQMYVPTIIYMLKISTERLMAYTYLLIYNLAFIIPLVLVFMMAYYGLTTEILAKLFRQRIAVIKLLTTIFFFGMGVLILLF